MKKGLFLFLALIVFQSNADDSCKSINLTIDKQWGKAAYKTTGAYTRWNSVFRQMPLYNQGAVGICYAYAAVQLVDYWRETMGIRVTQDIMLSSPIYAALLTRQVEGGRYHGKDKISSGNINEAIGAIKQFGMCRDDIIQNVVDKYAKGKSIDQREFTEILESLFVNFPADPQIIQKMPTEEIWNKYINGKFSFYSGRQIKNDGKIAEIFKLVAPYIKNGNIVQLMNELFQICKDPKSVYVGYKNLPDLKKINIRQQNFSDLQSFLRELLNKKNTQPIGISYCSKVLKEKNYIGTAPNPKFDGQMTTKDPNTCGSHASIIIGKQNIGGKCHYLIRNTWGDKCDYNWECKYNAQKQAVGIWVAEDALFKNLHEITWLEQAEYLCLAKNQTSEEIFSLDKPRKGVFDSQHFDLFNKHGYLVVRVGKGGGDSVDFLYGPNNKQLFSTKKMDIKDFNGTPPIDVEFNYPTKNVQFKLACLPYVGDKSKIIQQLKQKI